MTIFVKRLTIGELFDGNFCGAHMLPLANFASASFHFIEGLDPIAERLTDELERL